MERGWMSGWKKGREDGGQRRKHVQMEERVISLHTDLEMVLCPSCHFIVGATVAQRGKVCTQTWPGTSLQSK